MLHYICALPNKKGTAAPLEFISDDPVKIEEWARRHDRPGWGVYDCHNPLKPGATRRSKETIAEVRDIVVDIDPKDIVETVVEVDARVRELLLPFSWYNDSGRGRHGGFRLKEPVDVGDAEMIARVDTVRERLTEILCGDRQVMHHAALFRRPGTHNTKDGAWLECRALEISGAEYDLTELEEMVALYDRPLLTRRPAANGGENVAYIDFGAPKAPVDVEERLAAMRYGGANDTGINGTWWTCMGSLLRQGVSVVETINILHAAAEANCSEDPNRANWRKDLTGMAERWLSHEPEFIHGLDAHSYKQWHAAAATGKKPRLVWQNGYGLHVRGMSQPTPQPLGAAVADGGATITPLPQPAQPRIKPKPFRRLDEATLPRRQFYLGGHYMPKIVTATVAPGGAGKSNLSLVEAISMAIERDLLCGETLRGQRRVWYHNAEDGQDEIDRRIVAICKHYGIDQGRLEGWLFTTSGMDMPIKIAAGNGELRIDKGTVQLIIEGIEDDEIEVVIFDPLIAMHTTGESDNVKMRQVIDTFAAISNSTHCSVEVVHHVRKKAPGQDEHTTADSRGAGAIIDAVRCCRVMNGMSKGEAEDMGIDDIDRPRYVRLDRGKANMVQTGFATWLKFESVILKNDDPENDLPGDNVGVLVKWDPPDMRIPMGAADKAAIRAAVALDPECREDSRAKHWVGNIVAQRFNLDLEKAHDKRRVQATVWELLRNGTLARKEELDKQRRPRTFVIVGEKA